MGQRLSEYFGHHRVPPVGLIPLGHKQHSNESTTKDLLWIYQRSASYTVSGPLSRWATKLLLTSGSDNQTMVYSSCVPPWWSFVSLCRPLWSCTILLVEGNFGVKHLRECFSPVVHLRCNSMRTSDPARPTWSTPLRKKMPRM